MSTASTSRDAVRFATLLTLLFAMAAIAVRVILSVIEDLPVNQPQTTALLSFGILAVTLAFMCIAGAVGVWAIRFSTVREARRRVGRFVDELAPLQDGIMTMDRKGITIGCNPAMRKLAGQPVKGNEPLDSVFPCLSETDIELLLNPDEAHEIERSCAAAGAPPRLLRFRSQPAEDMHVLFVTDVTTRRTEEHRQEQLARFQLVGRIARGVAYDFNNILCGIASHGSLLRRLRPGSDDLLQSASIITREAERGVTLSRHLLDLSHSGMAGIPTDRLDQYTLRSAELLRIGLSSAWTVTQETEPDFEAVALSGIQIEQVILNLGLLAADSLGRPGAIHVSVHKPGADHLLQLNRSFAAVILLSAATDTSSAPLLPDKPEVVPTETGIILSVVRTMVEECGGVLECLANHPDKILFRVLIPRAIFPAQPADSELSVFLSGMRLLLAGRPEVLEPLSARIGRPENAVIHLTHDAVSLLTQAESDAGLDAILIDQRLIGHEPDAFLRALMKLCPQAGIVILRDDQPSEPVLTRGVIAIEVAQTSAELAGAIIEAKGLAHRLR